MIAFFFILFIAIGIDKILPLVSRFLVAKVYMWTTTLCHAYFFFPDFLPICSEKTDYHSHICISCWLSWTLTCYIFFFNVTGFFPSSITIYTVLFIKNAVHNSFSEKLSFINLIDHSITLNPIWHLYISHLHCICTYFSLWIVLVVCMW